MEYKLSNRNGKKIILVIGATGMLGNAVLRFFNDSDGYIAIGTARSSSQVSMLRQDLQDKVITGVDVGDDDSLKKILDETRPNVVINCVGLVKQLSSSYDPLLAIPINSLLPHRLALLCKSINARLIHLSTDCVFSGQKGGYVETDIPDAFDLYGRSKLLGEVYDFENTITLRTSIIGHELNGAHSLVNWYLSQKNDVSGYTKAIFSGLPTVELSRVIRDFVIPNQHLFGLYHVSVNPISKFELLNFIKNQYGIINAINPDSKLEIDRSLDSTRFRDATGYVPPSWIDLIQSMKNFK